MSRDCSRRQFFGGCAAFGAMSGMKAFALPGAKLGKVNVRFGVISDVHVQNDRRNDSRHLVKAFEYFRDHGADGVLIAGDIADQGRVSQFKYFADAWFKVFPGDKAPDGRKVEKLFVYGNHDVDGWRWGRNAQQMKDPAVIADAIGYNEETRAKTWEECLHEKYEPVWMKDVKGYKFIGRHWHYHNEMVEFFRRHAEELRGAKPFFYTQHDHPAHTCFGEWAWGHDDGTSTRVLSQFPNAISFTGHSHYTLTDERTIWQGAFTSINTSSMRYSSTDYNLRDNIGGNSGGYGKWQRSRVTPKAGTGDGKQGMLLEVGDDAIVIHRREFTFDQDLGDDWVIPLPVAKEKPFAYKTHAAKRVAPEFAKGAEVKVRRIKEGKNDLVVVSFPAAQTVDKCRVYEYEVTATLYEDDVDLVACQKRVMSPDYFLPAAKLCKSAQARFLVSELPPSAHLRFSVRPVECFGHKGAAITSTLFQV